MWYTIPSSPAWEGATSNTQTTGVINMATNSPANLRKPLRTKRSSTNNSLYKMVEVSCFDLARLLDFCESATITTQSGKQVSIDEIDWYRDAHREINLAFWACIKTGWRK